MSETISAAPSAPRVRSGWLKTLHLWHWISSALCLLGMFLFSITGITLNHASQIEAAPQVTRLQAKLPASVLLALKAEAALDSPQLPAAFSDWAAAHWRLTALTAASAEWEADELYLPMPRPGGDAWMRVTLDSGEAEYEITDRGWISYLNDLHKGRNSGVAWSWFIDLFAVVCLVFCITGLLILKFHAVARPLTWPMVGMGVVAPVLLVLLFVH